MVTEHLVGTRMAENGNGEHGLKLMNLGNLGQMFEDKSWH